MLFSHTQCSNFNELLEKDKEENQLSHYHKWHAQGQLLDCLPSIKAKLDMTIHYSTKLTLFASLPQRRAQSSHYLHPCHKQVCTAGGDSSFSSCLMECTVSFKGSEDKPV
jgi:hypothetical protein